MTTKQAGVIITLLTVVAVALTAGLVYLVMQDDGQSAAGPAGEETSGSPDDPGAEQVAAEVADPAAALEEAGIDVIRSAPVPEAPESWGDYELEDSWNGRLRLFPTPEHRPIQADDGGMFPATMNSCGATMYFVTFRSSHENATLLAQLINAVGEAEATKRLSDGWMLGTNCVTPSFGIDNIPGEANSTDVVYTVHEYRQSSVAAPPVAPSVPSTTPSAPTPPPEPTLVECQTGLGSMGRFSDGSVRQDQRCFDPVMAEAEGVCGGMGGHERVSRERYIELCGGPPPGG